MKKTVALFLVLGKYKEYQFFVKNSVESFKKWHPDVDVVIIDDVSDVQEQKIVTNYKFTTAVKFFDKYDKLIIIDADTITCARFDEFFQDDDTSVLATLDFPMDPVGYPYTVNKYALAHNHVECKNVNTGLTCFNNKQALMDVIDVMMTKEKLSTEQHALQYYMDTRPEKVRIVDFPYTFSSFVYNTRGHGTIGTDCIRDGKLFVGLDGPMIAEIAPTRLYKPVGSKLFNHLGKHVKMFHFVSRSPDIKNWFSEDTVKFFVEHCNCDWSLTN